MFCLIAITRRAVRVAMAGAVLEARTGRARSTSAIAVVAIFAVTDQLLLGICEEMRGGGLCLSWSRTGQSGDARRIRRR